MSKERSPGHSNEEKVRINIGGLMFETAASILRRDPTSLLAQLCPGGESSSTHPPLLLPDSEGAYYFDRDWWDAVWQMTRVNPHMRPGADHSECSLPHFTKIKVAVSTFVTISARWIPAWWPTPASSAVPWGCFLPSERNAESHWRGEGRCIWCLVSCFL